MGGQKSVYEPDEYVIKKKNVSIKKGIYRKSKSNMKERVKVPKENLNNIDDNKNNNTEIVNNDKKDADNVDDDKKDVDNVDEDKKDVDDKVNEESQEKSENKESVVDENKVDDNEKDKKNNDNVKDEKVKIEEKNQKKVKEVHVPFQEVHDFPKYRAVNKVKSGRFTTGKKHELFSKNSISPSNKRKTHK